MHYYRGSPSKPPYICIHLHCLIPPKNGSESHFMTPETKTSGKSQFFNAHFFKKSDSPLPGTNSTRSLENVNILAKPNSSKGVLVPKRGPMTSPGFAPAPVSLGVWGKSTTIMEDPQMDGSETHKPHSDGATKKHWNTQNHLLPALAWVVIVEHVQLCSTINLFNHMVLRLQVSLLVGYPLPSPSTITIRPISWWSWTITNHWWEKWGTVRMNISHHYMISLHLVKCMANSSNMYSRFSWDMWILNKHAYLGSSGYSIWLFCSYGKKGAKIQDYLLEKATPNVSLQNKKEQKELVTVTVTSRFIAFVLRNHYTNLKLVTRILYGDISKYTTCSLSHSL